MTIRARIKVETAISSSTAEERDLGYRKIEVVTDGLGEGGTWKTKLPASTTNLEVSLRDVEEGALVVISSNSVSPNDTPATVTIKRNSTAGEDIDLVPLSGTKSAHFLLTTAGLTAIYATNESTVDMELTITICGD